MPCPWLVYILFAVYNLYMRLALPLILSALICCMMVSNASYGPAVPVKKDSGALNACAQAYLGCLKQTCTDLKGVPYASENSTHYLLNCSFDNDSDFGAIVFYDSDGSANVHNGPVRECANTYVSCGFTTPEGAAQLKNAVCPSSFVIGSLMVLACAINRKP